MEIAAFLIACASFMTPEETLALTQSMIASGSRLTWQRPLVVDKHCIGGIPGNRTSLIVAPIVAAHGLLIPKTSSRAITSPAGTADTMEVLARVDLREDEMRAVVDRCGACIVWGGRVDLSPADDVLDLGRTAARHRHARADGGLDPVEEGRRRLDATW